MNAPGHCSNCQIADAEEPVVAVVLDASKIPIVDESQLLVAEVEEGTVSAPNFRFYCSRTGVLGRRLALVPNNPEVVAARRYSCDEAEPSLNYHGCCFAPPGDIPLEEEPLG